MKREKKKCSIVFFAHFFKTFDYHNSKNTDSIKKRNYRWIAEKIFGPASGWNANLLLGSEELSPRNVCTVTIQVGAQHISTVAIQVSKFRRAIPQ